MRLILGAWSWTGQRLVDEIATVAPNLKWTTSVVTNLTSGRRRFVTVDELIALGNVFGVEPWGLTREAACARCQDAPANGFTCNECGASRG